MAEETLDPEHQTQGDTKEGTAATHLPASLEQPACKCILPASAYPGVLRCNNWAAPASYNMHFNFSQLQLIAVHK